MSMNNWVDAVTLVSITSTKDSDGFDVDVEHKVEHIVANFKSVSRAEELHSNSLGYKADLMVEMMLVNYSNESILIDEKSGKRYAIKRTYVKSPELIELTCSDLSRKV